MSIEAAIERVRRDVLERHPHQAGLFDRIYGSRFTRLRRQFRSTPAARKHEDA